LLLGGTLAHLSIVAEAQEAFAAQREHVGVSRPQGRERLHDLQRLCRLAMPKEQARQVQALLHAALPLSLRLARPTIVARAAATLSERGNSENSTTECLGLDAGTGCVSGKHTTECVPFQR
jgi:hypothetical protein